MHHAKRPYRSHDRKQRRQMVSSNFIPSLSMKSMHDRKAYEAGHPRRVVELGHVEEPGMIGGPVETHDDGLTETPRKRTRRARPSPTEE